MINHARTLLINRAGGSQNLRELGEEYIPAEFTGQNLPPWLAMYQQVLFGSNPENIYLNLQADRLLRLVHATEYEPYLTLFDDRLTYDPRAASPFAEVQYGYSFESSSGVIRQLSRVGEVAADEARGIMRRRWYFDMVNKVATVTDMLSRATSTTALGGSASVSNVFTLPGSSFRIRMSTVRERPAADWDDKFEIVLLTRPTTGLTDKIAELETLREHERRLFGSDVVEPYVTFFGLWRTAKTLPEQLAGILLALVFRLHDNYRTRTS